MYYQQAGVVAFSLPVEREQSYFTYAEILTAKI